MTDKAPKVTSTVTRIKGSNVRQEGKPTTGSPFGSLCSQMRSCFKCGKHRVQSQLRTIKILGRAERVCAPSCKETEVPIDARADHSNRRPPR
jgi:hypothetical protein